MFSTLLRSFWWLNERSTSIIKRNIGRQSLRKLMILRSNLWNLPVQFQRHVRYIKQRARIPETIQNILLFLECLLILCIIYKGNSEHLGRERVRGLGTLFIHNPGSAQYVKEILRYWSPSLYEHKLQMGNHECLFGIYFSGSNFKKQKFNFYTQMSLQKTKVP